MCESLAALMTSKYRDLLLSVLLCIPLLLLLGSYWLFFPLATYQQGRLGYTNKNIGPLLDIFHFGQSWWEFGYNVDGITIETINTEVRRGLNWFFRRLARLSNYLVLKILLYPKENYLKYFADSLSDNEWSILYYYVH